MATFTAIVSLRIDHFVFISLRFTRLIIASNYIRDERGLFEGNSLMCRKVTI